MSKSGKLVCLARSIAKCLSFTEECVADIAACNYHPCESSSVPVLSVALYGKRTGIDQLTQSFLGSECQNQLMFASAVEALRRIDVDKADRFALVLERVAIDEDHGF